MQNPHSLLGLVFVAFHLDLPHWLFRQAGRRDPDLTLLTIYSTGHMDLQLKFQFRTFASNNLHFIFYTLYNLQRWTDGNLQLKFQLTAFTSYAQPLCNHYSLGYKIECK